MFKLTFMHRRYLGTCIQTLNLDHCTAYYTVYMKNTLLNTDKNVYTVRKIQDFSVIQILQEINFGGWIG